MNWEEAQANCTSLGGHLVKVNDAEEDKFTGKIFREIVEYNYNAFWIGLRLNSSTGTYLWYDDSAFKYNRTIYKRAGACILAYLDTNFISYWEAVSCSVQVYSLCEKELAD